MHEETQIAKWGNSLAVRIPRTVLRKAGLDEGDRVALGVDAEGNIVVRGAKRRYSLEELLDGVTPDNVHGEVQWGSPRGKEIW